MNDRSRPRLAGIAAYYAVALCVFAVDFVSKKIVEYGLALNDRIDVFGNGLLIVTSIRNPGAAFGMMQQQRWLFLLLSLAVVAGVAWYFHRSFRSGRRLLPLALSLVLGGAVGNFLDRLLFGQVVDFLQFNFGRHALPIFNLADTGIVVGVVLLIADAVRSVRQESVKHGNGERPNGEPSRERQPI
jgi:signal peptidase II